MKNFYFVNSQQSGFKVQNADIIGNLETVLEI